jgi:hypothetical protein
MIILGSLSRFGWAAGLGGTSFPGVEHRQRGSPSGNRDEGLVGESCPYAVLERIPRAKCSLSAALQRTTQA